MKQEHPFVDPNEDPAQQTPETYPGLRYVIGFREAARALYECDGDIQLAEYAEPSDYMASVRLPNEESHQKGVWVEAWLWVADSDVVTRDDEIGLMETERIWPDFEKKDAA